MAASPRGVKRKREEESDVDLWYPYDASRLVPMPPTVDAGSGLQVDGFRLSIHHGQPLEARNGILGLKLGEGLQTDPKTGALTATGSQLTAEEPIRVADRRISLQVGQGLQVQQQQLAVKVQQGAPLTQSEAGLGVAVGQGLQVQDNRVQLSVNPHSLEIGDQGLGVKLPPQAGLQADAAGLQLKLKETDSALQKDGQGLAVKLADTSLQSGPEGLRLRPGNQSCLDVASEGVCVQVAPAGCLQRTTAGLSIRPGIDSCLDTSETGLTVKVAQGLEKTGEGLTVKLQDNKGLKTTQDGMYLDIGAGLQYSGGKVTTKLAGHTLKYSSGGLCVGLGWGLKQGANGVALDMQFPLTVNKDGLYIRTGEGIQVNNNNLCIKLQNNKALKVDSNGLYLDLNDGLHFVDGKLKTKVANATIQYYNGGLGVAIADNSIKFNERGIYVPLGWGLEIGFYGMTPKLKNMFTKDVNGIGIKMGHGLEQTTSGDIKLKILPPLTLSANGLCVDYDSNSVYVDNGKLKLRQDANVAYAEYGSENFEGNTSTQQNVCTAYVAGASTNSENICRAFILLKGYNRMVNGILRVKFINSELRRNQGNNNPLKVGFILDPAQSISEGLRCSKKIPNTNDTLTKLKPANSYINLSQPFENLQFYRYLEPNNLKWYNEYKVKPCCVGTSVGETTLYLSTLHHRESTNAILYFSLWINGITNFFTGNDSQRKSITIMDMPFSYEGSAN